MDSASDLPLCDDETLKRRNRREDFVVRGPRSSDGARRIGSYRCAEAVHEELHRRMASPAVARPRLRFVDTSQFAPYC